MIELPKIVVPWREITRLRQAGKSLSEVCTELDKMKVPTPSQEREWGKDKRDIQHLKKRKWTRTAVWRIMQQKGIG